MDDKIEAMLAKLGTKLGTTAEYLWGAQVKYEVATGITGLCLSALLVVAFAALVAVLVTAIRKNSAGTLSDEASIPVFMFGGMAALGAALGVGFSFYNSLPKLLAPEGAALHTILGALK